ncbi:hypothetical protein BE11_06670 [Sorangium cellulosum]|nr:hypothetical protein BE11_06670 [Sorangium cellulosum]
MRGERSIMVVLREQRAEVFLAVAMATGAIMGGSSPPAAALGADPDGHEGPVIDDVVAQE